MEKLIAVIGATGQQGGSSRTCSKSQRPIQNTVLGSRNPEKHRELADEVTEADLNRPETLATAFKGAYGIFLVTTSWLEGNPDGAQAGNRRGTGCQGCRRQARSLVHAA